MSSATADSKRTTPYTTARKFCAGGVSCLISSSILNPCDLVKVRLQIQKSSVEAGEALSIGFMDMARKIVRDEGILALWSRGLGASAIRELTYSSARMGLYDPIRDLLNEINISGGKKEMSESGLLLKIAAGGLSGAIGSSLVNPSDVVKIRFQAEARMRGKPSQYGNTINAFYMIGKEEGLKGLYRGVSATVFRAAILTASQLSSYDHSKHYLLKHYPEYFSDNPTTHITCALFSGLVTAFTTNPNIAGPLFCWMNGIVNDRYGVSSQYKSVIDCIVKTVGREGFLALYKGFIPNYLRLGPHFVISLPLYEQFRKLLGVHTL